MSELTLLGLHRPGTTWLHRLRPGTKLLGLFLLGIVVLWTTGPGPAIGLFALTLGLAVWSGMSAATVLRTLRGFLVVGALLMAFHVWQNGWPRAIEVVLDLFTLILASTVLTATTAVDDLLDTIVWGIGPLRRIGVDPDRVALSFSLMLRAVPGTLDIAAETRDAARARGLEHSLRARTTPLVIRVVGRARETGDALTARGILDDDEPER